MQGARPPARPPAPGPTPPPRAGRRRREHADVVEHPLGHVVDGASGLHRGEARLRASDVSGSGEVAHEDLAAGGLRTLIGADPNLELVAENVAVDEIEAAIDWYAGGTNYRDVVKRAADELGMTPREAMDKLRGLPAGSFYVFGPALLPTGERGTNGPVAPTPPEADRPRGHKRTRIPPPSTPHGRGPAVQAPPPRGVGVEALRPDAQPGAGECRADLDLDDPRDEDEAVVEVFP